MKTIKAFSAALGRAGFLLPTRFVSGAELKLNTHDCASFNYQTNGVVSGPAAHIIGRTCREMKVDCSMHLLPWRHTQEEVSNEIAQGLFTIGWNNDERPSGKRCFPTPPWNQH